MGRRRQASPSRSGLRTADFRSAAALAAALALLVCCGRGGSGGGRLVADDGAAAPAAGRSAVYASPTGSRYHLRDCRTLGSKVEDLSLEDALARGLEPCRICRPPVPGGPEPYRLDSAGLASSAQADRRRMSAARVLRVVDGDTVRVALAAPRPALLKAEETIRLLGIDAPESASSPRPEGHYGAESAAYLRSLLEGREVLLAHDRDLRDKYGRLLAYLYTPEEGCVNLRLVEEGYAAAYLSFPFAFSEEFRAAGVRARASGRGLWAAGP